MVWRWRRRARILASALSLIPSVLIVSMAVMVEKRDVDEDYNIALWLALLVVLNVPAIGILTLENVAREYIVSRATLNKHIRENVDDAYSKTVDVSGASVRAVKTWVADGFKEEEDSG